MRSDDRQRRRAWTVVAKPELLGCLAPLLRIRATQGPVRIVATLTEALEGASAVLVVGGAPVDSVFLKDGEGHPVPVGWLAGRVDIAMRYAESQAQRQRIEDAAVPGPVALLAQWEDRSLGLADDIERNMAGSPLRWSADRIARRDVLPALWSGVGAAMYVGHGEDWGWMGYGGVTARHWLQQRGDPAGAVLSLTCKSARIGSVESFCDALVAGGGAGAVLGCQGDSVHSDNRRLALALAERLGSAPSLAACLEGIPSDWLRGYRISGDPAASLNGTEGAWERAARVYAPHPDAVLAQLG